jgi:hypothetical protein
MQGELTGLDVLFLAALLDQSLGQLGAFAISDHPAGDVAGMPIPRLCRLSRDSDDREALALCPESA